MSPKGPYSNGWPRLIEVNMPNGTYESHRLVPLSDAERMREALEVAIDTLARWWELPEDTWRAENKAALDIGRAALNPEDK